MAERVLFSNGRLVTESGRDVTDQMATQLMENMGLPIPAVGDYIGNSHVSRANGAIAQGVAKVGALLVPTRMTFDRISAELVTVGPSSDLRLVVYNHDAATARPGSLVLDAGVIDGDATIGAKTITIDLTLEAGLYWIGGIGQGGTSGAVWRQASGGVNVHSSTFHVGGAFQATGYQSASSMAGAADATFGTSSAAIGPPLVGLRRAADPS